MRRGATQVSRNGEPGLGIATALALAAAADLLLERLRPPGLVYPPGRTLSYRTHEFASEVRINALGFRGRLPEEPAPEGTLRIATIGDSFTYGWGVGDDEACRRASKRSCEIAAFRSRC